MQSLSLSVTNIMNTFFFSHQLGADESDDMPLLSENLHSFFPIFLPCRSKSGIYILVSENRFIQSMSTCGSQLLFIDLNTPVKNVPLSRDRWTGAPPLGTGHRSASGSAGGCIQTLFTELGATQVT